MKLPWAEKFRMLMSENPDDPDTVVDNFLAYADGMEEEVEKKMDKSMKDQVLLNDKI